MLRWSGAPRAATFGTLRGSWGGGGHALGRAGACPSCPACGARTARRRRAGRAFRRRPTRPATNRRRRPDSFRIERTPPPGRTPSPRAEQVLDRELVQPDEPVPLRARRVDVVVLERGPVGEQVLV